ncbi:hypothetical protein [Flavivirga rizhaonensis]|uniref:DUF4595 domain-containing protein n=1 Tax=Flavivirga rizhaonensis TaxID=2559571 RepID=A0A4S1DYQ8_9FLAO|nr:hypothetical protein [Flavivirga rizhaonensis]TGV03357.1 hypothetical protein EM932_06700 [Flavivirga rizhaonensis]
MKNIQYINSFFILLVLFASCSSDDSSSVEEQIPQTRVKTINENDINFYDVEYKDDGKIATINKSGSGNSSITYAYNTQNLPIQKGEASYEYNAQGKLSKITTSDYTTEITYDQEGKIVLEEAVANTYNLDKTFKYNTEGQLIEIAEHFISNNSGLAPYKKYIITYTSNGSIAEILERQSIDDFTYVDKFESKFGYDDKKNPLLNLHENSGGKEGLSYYMGVLSFHTNSITNLPPSLYFYGKNNLLFHTRTDLDDNKQYKTTYQHQYNQDGYPETTTKTIFNPNSQNSTELIYDWTYEKK